MPEKEALCIFPGFYESTQFLPGTKIVLAGLGQIIIDDYFGFIDLVCFPNTTSPALLQHLNQFQTFTEIIKLHFFIIPPESFDGSKHSVGIIKRAALDQIAALLWIYNFFSGPYFCLYI